MSNMAQPDATTQQQKQQGTETFLSPEERQQLRRLMSHPTDYPKEMMAHIREWLSVNPPDFVASTFKGGKGQARYLDRAVASAMTAASGSGEKTMYSYNLKAKTLSPSGQLRILFFWTAQSPDVSNSATVKVKLGGTEVLSLVIGDASSEFDGNARPGMLDILIVNAGAYNAQYAVARGVQNRESGVMGAIQTVGTSAVDLSADKTLTLTNTWSSGDANDIVAPKYVAVEVFNPVGA